MAQKFTELGAAQLMRDSQAINSVVERYVPDGPSSLDGLGDAVKLLNLPVQPQEGGVSLKRATDMAFTDNVEAKKLLDELEIDSLSPANARQILQRRVENSD